MNTPKRILLAYLVLTSIAWAEKPKVIEEIHGTVAGVIDGDTLTLHTSGKPSSIRLEGIDAPESGQKFGPESRDALKHLVAGKEITVRKTGVDQYGRIIGIVMVGRVDVCAKQIEDGWAWHFKKYNSDESLAQLENAAKAAKRGLWADTRPDAPWDYRAKKKEPKEVTVTPFKSTAPKSVPTPPPTAPPPVASPVEDRSGMVWVNGYTRKNGTVVKGYWRRK
jgi:micrococcal nuclease